MTGATMRVGSPVGTLTLRTDGVALTALSFTDDVPDVGTDTHSESSVLVDTRQQLAAYFAGRLRVFDVPLAPVGSPFQLRVWDELLKIPYGTTASYGDIAARLGMSLTASRAVGLANGANPIAIIVPCHRVIGSNGSLVGYGGGLRRKRFLLSLESPTVQDGLFEAL
jgi:methylated-DNA-[protein]-cysteine S-methyltransferase